MGDDDTAEAVTDTGIPADMVEDDGAEGNEHGDVTGLATRLGWMPKDKYRGPAEKWLPASDFIGKVEKETPVLRERLRFQDTELKKRDQQITDLTKRFDEQGGLLKELLEFNKEAKQRGYDTMRQEIEAEMDMAAANADMDGYKAAKRKLSDLERTRPASEAKPNGTSDPGKPNGNGTTQLQVDPVVGEWARENTWFETDPELNGVAVGINTKLMREKPGLSVRERLDEVSKRVKERYPDMFENSARRAPPAVGASNGNPNPPRKPKGRTEADLPADARAVMNRLIAQKVLTKEQYLKDYPWDKP